MKYEQTVQVELQEYICMVKRIDVVVAQKSLEQELIRCKDCKHRFEGEKYPNCCEVLMEMSQWLVEIPVKDEWHCGSGERKEE